MMNWIVILLSGLIPMIIGFIYYSEKVAGRAWMNASGMTAEKIQGSNMAVILGVSLLFSLFLALGMYGLVVHQSHLYSLVQNQPNFMDPTSEAGSMVKAMMDKYGTNFRTFKHGALHGFIASVLLALPIIGMNALFERRGGKYIFIHWAYWAITFLIMGGVICQWA